MIEEIFNQDFSHWGIRLPPDDITSRRRGRISAHGWTIWYLFGSGGDKEYLDYYAMHRMTNDRHVRIYSDGTVEWLEAIDGFHVTSDDPEEAARLKAEFYARNKAVAKMLEDKGFSFSSDGPEDSLSGDEPANIFGQVLNRVNRYLVTTPEEEREEG